MCRFKMEEEGVLMGSCNFNTSYVSVQVKYLIVLFYLLLISIHLMCRFKYHYAGYAFCSLPFQYILCVGSSFSKYIFRLIVIYFNTSYVSVQGECSRSFLVLHLDFNTSYVSVQVCFMLKEGFVSVISIHLMCRFKNVDKGLKNYFKEFQYILCVGSSELQKSKPSKTLEFQYILCVGSRALVTLFILNKVYFNTSYVSVQVKLATCEVINRAYFNTSYVSVQELPVVVAVHSGNLFQYILCVGSS